MKAEDSGQISFAIGLDTKPLLSGVARAGKGFDDMADKAASAGRRIEETFARGLTTLAKFSGVGLIGMQFTELADSIKRVRGEFQQLEVAFETMLGSADKSNALMAQLVQTAATTPFGLQEVASGAKQLLAYGTAAEDVNKKLIQLGDIAAGLSLPLNDLVYLYGTTMTQGRMFTQDLRQFQGRGIPIAEELAKQFGVATSRVGDLVTAGRVTAKEFNAAIESMASEGGRFGGLMAKQSKTIVGQISNIEDAIDMALNDVGKESEGVINAALEGTAYLVEHWREVGSAIMDAAVAFGAYKATLMAVSAYNNVATGVAYNEEIAQLQKLLPVKEVAKMSDIEAAVATGRLTKQKAALIAEMRAEAAAYAEQLAVTEAAEMAKYHAAKQDADIYGQLESVIEEQIAALEEEASALFDAGDSIGFEAAQLEINTLNTELNEAAKLRQAAAERAGTAFTDASTAAMHRNSLAQIKNAASTNILKGAWNQLKTAVLRTTAALMANPLILVAAAVAALTYGIYKLATADSAAEKAAKKHKEARDEQKQALEEDKRAVDEYLSIIKDETKTDYQRAKAYDELAKKMPSLTKAYTQQELAAMGAAEQQKLLNQEMENMEFEQLVKNVDEAKSKFWSLEESKKHQGGIRFNKKIDEAREALRLAENELYNFQKLQEKARLEARPIEVRLAEAKENEEVAKRVLGWYEKFDQAAHRYNEAIANGIPMSVDAAKNSLDDLESDLDKTIADLREKAKKSPIKFNPELEKLERLKKQIEESKQSWYLSGLLNIPFTFTFDFKAAEGAVEDAGKKLAALETNETDKKVEAKRRREALIKAYREREAARGTADYKDKDDAYKIAEEEAKEYGFDISKLTGKKDKKSSKEMAAERQKRELDMRRAEEDIARQRTKEAADHEMAVWQARIDAMEEGARKVAEQREKDRREEMRALTEQRENAIRTEIDRQRSLFEHREADKVENSKGADGKATYVAANFTDANIDQTQIKEINRRYDRLLIGVARKFVRQNTNLAQAESAALDEALKLYGTYQQKRAAIASDFDRQIATATTEGERLRLRMEKETAIKELEATHLKEELNWDALFNDLDNLSIETLRKLKAQVREALDMKDVTAENAKVLAESLSNIEAAIRDKQNMMANLLGWGNSARQELASRRAEAAEAQALADKLETVKTDKADKLNEVTASINILLESMGRGDVKPTVESLTQIASELEANGLSSEAEKLREQIATLQTATTECETATKNAADAQRKATNAQEKAKKTLKDFFDILNESLDKVSANLASVDDLLDNLGLADTDFGQKASALAGGVNDGIGAFKDFQSGNYIGALAKAVSGIGKTLEGLGITGDSDKSYDSDMVALTESNRALKNAIDSLAKDMKNASPRQALEIYTKQLNNARQQQANLQEQLRRSGAAYKNGWKGSHSSNYHIDEKSGIDWSAVTKAAGTTVTSAAQFWELTSQQMARVAKDAPQIYALIKNYADNGYKDAAQYMDEYVGMAERIEEISKSYREVLVDTNFDSVYDEFKSMLLDMDSDVTDFADDFENKIRRAVLNSTLNKYFKESLKRWYDSFASAMESDERIDLREQEALRQEYETISRNALAMRREIESAMGWTGSTKSATASSRGFNAMTQETASELNGRFTALQISNEDIRQISERVAGDVAVIRSQMEKNTELAEDIRGMQLAALDLLDDIDKNTFRLHEIADKIDKIERNTRNI